MSVCVCTPIAPRIACFFPHEAETESETEKRAEEGSQGMGGKSQSVPCGYEYLTSYLASSPLAEMRLQIAGVDPSSLFRGGARPRPPTSLPAL